MDGNRREPTPLDSKRDISIKCRQVGTVDAQENIILSSYANAMQEVSKEHCYDRPYDNGQSGVC